MAVDLTHQKFNYSNNIMQVKIDLPRLMTISSDKMANRRMHVGEDRILHKQELLYTTYNSTSGKVLLP